MTPGHPEFDGREMRVLAGLKLSTRRNGGAIKFGLDKTCRGVISSPFFSFCCSVSQIANRRRIMHFGVALLRRIRLRVVPQNRSLLRSNTTTTSSTPSMPAKALPSSVPAKPDPAPKSKAMYGTPEERFRLHVENVSFPPPRHSPCASFPFHPSLNNTTQTSLRQIKLILPFPLIWWFFLHRVEQRRLKELEEMKEEQEMLKKNGVKIEMTGGETMRER